MNWIKLNNYYKIIFKNLFSSNSDGLNFEPSSLLSYFGAMVWEGESLMQYFSCCEQWYDMIYVIWYDSDI